MVPTAFHTDFVHVYRNKRHSKFPWTSVDWPPIMIGIREVQDSIFGQQTGYNDRRLSRDFLDSPRQLLEQQASASFHILPTWLLTFNPTTRHYVAWITDCVLKAPAALLPGKELRYSLEDKLCRSQTVGSCWET